MRNFFFRLLSIWAILLFCLIFVVIFPFHLIFLFINRPWSHDLSHGLNALWGRTVATLSGVRFRLEGKKQFDRKKVYVLVSNHTSYFDIPACNVGIPMTFRFMGKAELNRVPFFGFMFRRLHVPVNRGSKTDSFRSYVGAGEKLKENRSVLLYPEATIPDKRKVVLGRFKNGAFRLAIEHQKPILPMVLIGADKVLPDNGRFLLHPGKIRIHFGDPIETAGMKIEDADALSDRVREWMLGVLAENGILQKEEETTGKTEDSGK